MGISGLLQVIAAQAPGDHPGPPAVQGQDQGGADLEHPVVQAGPGNFY